MNRRKALGYIDIKMHFLVFSKNVLQLLWTETSSDIFMEYLYLLEKFIKIL